jgi:hypothetical protein
MMEGMREYVEIMMEHADELKKDTIKSIFEKVQDRVGMTSSAPSHVHTHDIIGGNVGYNYRQSNVASFNGQEAFKALCDIVEEELNKKVSRVTPKENENEFLDEDEMNIK